MSQSFTENIVRRLCLIPYGYGVCKQDLADNMKLYWCGFNGFGQCSDTRSTLIHFKESPVRNAIDVSFSWAYCVILSDSGLFIGGLPVCGSGEDCEPNLKKLNLPCLEKITQASCCKNHILTLTETGNCWQYLTDTGTWKQISNFAATETSSSVRIVNVCCSETLNIALSESGMVYSIPVALSTPSTEKVVQVACGLEHCLLLTATGQVYSWGTGTRGQLGHGVLESECDPRPVAALGGLRVIRVAAGGWHSACITEEGDLYTFGWNSSGQLGLPTQTQGDKRMKLSDHESVVTVTAVPVPVTWKEGDVFVIDVACGSRHTLALLEDRSLWGCGWNGYGQLAEDPKCSSSWDLMRQIPVPEGVSVKNVRCGAWNSSFFVE